MSTAATSDSARDVVPARGRNDALDAIKGIGMTSVLLLHIFSRDQLEAMWAWFHIWQAVPVLLLLMGYAGAHTRVTSLPDYARRRLKRLFIPLGVVWLLSLAVAVFARSLSFEWAWLAGKLPATGPGNYFVTLAVTFSLVLPLLRWLKERGDAVLLGVAAGVNIAFELFAWRFELSGFAYSANLLRVLFVVSLGMVIATNPRVARAALWLAPLSALYLVWIALGHRLPFFVASWQAQALFASAYAAAMVVLGLRLRYWRGFGVIGQASWHIFLLQILWFGLAFEKLVRALGNDVAAQAMAGVVSLAVCIGAGYVFWRVESKLLSG